jgi:hypothetical protein
MMKLSKLNNDQLIDMLKNKTQEERSLTLEIIELLEEVDRRKLYLHRAYNSLLEFCVKELKYSESAAYRRISAMRITKDVPQTKALIQNGTLNIVTLAQAQTFFNQEKKYNNKTYTNAEKKNLVEQLENKNKRECEKILLEKSPDLPKTEKVRQLTPTKTQITLTLDEELIKKLETIKNLYSHRNPNPNYSELIEMLADEILKKSKRSNATPPGGVASGKKVNLSLKRTNRYIPSTIKQEVYMRDKGCCTFTDQRTQRRCNSRHLLQYDHIKPMAFHGTTSVQNLRLLCFQHHKLITEKTFGLFKRE